MTTRSILSIKTTTTERIGHLETRNALGAPADETFDPFLILGHHGPQIFAPANAGMPFDDHPHRGFETVTVVLDGDLVHTDSSGHHRVVRRGGVQWMTAGAGVVHNEQVTPAFLRDGGTLEIIQIWINLPARLKMTTPAYTGVQAEGVRVVQLDNGSGTLHLVAGTHGDVTGPVETLTGVFMSWVHLHRERHARLPAPRGRTILFYVVRGTVVIDGRTATGGELVRFDDAADEIEVGVVSEALILYAHADPIGEPVAWRGPFVMNTDAELNEAFRDYRAGAFDAPPAAAEIGGDVSSQPRTGD